PVGAGRGAFGAGTLHREVHRGSARRRNWGHEQSGSGYGDPFHAAAETRTLVNRDLRRGHVRSAGHQPIFADDDSHGVVAAKASRPVLTLLDVVMPDQDGEKTWRRCRATASSTG